MRPNTSTSIEGGKLRSLAPLARIVAVAIRRICAHLISLNHITKFLTRKMCSFSVGTFGERERNRYLPTRIVLVTRKNEVNGNIEMYACLDFVGNEDQFGVRSNKLVKYWWHAFEVNFSIRIQRNECLHVSEFAPHWWNVEMRKMKNRYLLVAYISFCGYWLISW